MQRITKVSFIVVLAIAVLALVLPTLAQQDASDMPNTITVTGSGTAAGAPDMATIDLGVEFVNASVGEAYAQANAGIETIINALLEVGVAREDLRTSGINVYSEMMPSMDGTSTQTQYRVMNRLLVVVRDLSLVEAVVDAAVNSGANSIYGLNFGISDTAALETQARAESLEQARARAEELASNIGATLGEVVTVVEVSGGFGGPIPMMDMAQSYGGGGVSIEPGQLSVSVSVQVTYNFTR